MNALLPCGECGCHVRLSETSCPHCGATLRSAQGGFKRSTAAMIAGLSTAAFLSVAACGSDEDGSGGGDGGTSMADGGGGATSTGTPTGMNVGGVYGVGPGGFGGEGGTGANVGGAYGVGPGGFGGDGGAGGAGGN